MASVSSSVSDCVVDCFTASLRNLGCDAADTTCACTDETIRKLGSDGDLVDCLESSCSDSEFDDSGTPTSTNDTNESSSDAPSGGLSAGAKGGIAAGVVVGVLLVVGLAIFFWHRQRSKKPFEARRAGSPPGPVERAELDGIPRSELEAKPPTGLDSVYPAELSGEDIGKALPAMTPLVEAPSTPTITTSPTEQSKPVELDSTFPPVTDRSSEANAKITAVETVDNGDQTDDGNTAKETNSAVGQASPTIEAAAVAHQASPQSGPSSAELEQLLRSHEELEARRKTLEELSKVQEQQAALQERIQQLTSVSTDKEHQ
ncbi:hypothetical protein jhhlp_007510 [Lomentospora prolificans]|uniref:CFEM domain-containing protein n=1 Tax=Lomentospora prolificans TaxID=41688 RepID=A0A2N3N190_9PEZI|nr:hypothetical protein jhhlp_007510 [Lomentospora prolificans]